MIDLTLGKPIIQKIFKYNRSKSGNTVFSRQQIGIMIAGVSPVDPDTVVIGYSLCHRNDRYNRPGGVIKPNFDKALALQRAFKWDTGDYTVPPLPYSIHKTFGKFVHRCRTYYKDRHLTDWVNYADYKVYKRPAPATVVDENAEGC